MKSRIVFFFLVVGLIAQVNAAEYYVAPGGDDTRDGTSWAQAWKTISNGVFKAAEGSTLILSNGEYALTAQVSLQKEITLTNATGIAADVVVNGGGEVRCFYLNHSKAVVDGITISNGYGHTATPNLINEAYGGGVYVKDGILRHCVIRNNTAATNDEVVSKYAGYGGGAYLSGGMLMDSQVLYNFAGSKLGVGGNGGGVYVSSNAVVSNCMIMGNTSRYYGGGISCANTGNVVNCCLMVSNETTGNGGGICFSYGALLNSTCIWNTASVDGGGIHAVGGVISNCLVASNRSADATWGGGGIWNYYAAGATSYLYNSTIRGNSATNGGGVYYRASQGFIRDCVIEQNSASVSGGGICNYADQGALTVSNSIIRANTASGGGGIAISQERGYNMDQCLIVSNISRGSAGGFSSPVNTFRVRNCRFIGNIATNDGGGVYIVASVGSLTNSLLCNSLFYNNSACNGGGICIVNWGSMANCTVVSNFASTKGGGLYYANSSGATRTALVDNCVIYSNSCSSGPNWSYSFYGNICFNNSCTFPVPSGKAIGVNTITNDPRLSNIEGMDCRLLSDSPCINTGSNQEWMASFLDLDGHQRLDHFSRLVDMGAYEYLLKGMMFMSR